MNESAEKSSTWMSRQHALNMIKLLYEKEGFIVSDRCAGESIYQSFGVEIPDDLKVGCLFPFLDEIIYIYHVLSLGFIGSIANQHPEHALNYQFCRAAKELLSAIRLSSSHGMDLSAKLHIRPLLELIQTWHLVNVDEEAKEAFVQSKDFSAANAFWHRYAKKTRGENIIETKFAQVGKLSPFSTENLKALLPIIGAVIHPSHLAISITASSAFHNASDSLVFEDIRNATAFC